MWSWRVGGIFHPTPNSSIYVMHGTSFNPSSEFLNVSTTNNLITLAPEENETTEVGSKADVRGGTLSLATAVFRTEKTNLRVNDPILGVMTLGGKARVDGFEASATGKITDRWQIITSYTHLRSEIVSSPNAAQAGLELLMTPRNAVSLWTTYDVTREFQIGGGAFYVGAMWGNADNTTRVPEYWRFDAMAAYKVTKYATLQLNVYNLFDKVYYAGVYNNWVVPGPSRYATLALRVRFSPDSPLIPAKLVTK
jgi:catecholate siderophore receptor